MALAALLDLLGELGGPPEPRIAADGWELVLAENVAYLVDDERRREALAAPNGRSRATAHHRRLRRGPACGRGRDAARRADQPIAPVRQVINLLIVAAVIYLIVIGPAFDKPFTDWGPPGAGYPSTAGREVDAAVQARRELIPGARATAVTLGVGDLDQVLRRVLEDHGRIVIERTTIPGAGELAILCRPNSCT